MTNDTHDDRPTAWEEINPPMVSAKRQGQVSTSSDSAEARRVFRNELTSCLALVAPVGMSAEAKRDWLTVAWRTLGHLPPHILAIGCAKARETCDHPSKIVPAMIAETAEMMRWRRDSAKQSEPLRIAAKPNYCTASQASEILEQYGLKRKSSGA